jgi:predicted transcriptional regulator
MLNKNDDGNELQLHIGDSLDRMGERFIGAWRRAERGELTEANAERHLGFESLATFARIMTPRRVELLRHVHSSPPRSIRALALALGRDYRRVHDDVEALVAAGLLDRDGRGLRAEYDRVRMEATLTL